MTLPTFHYDEISDTLYVSYSPGEKATGFELNDYSLLRINKKDSRAVVLTVLAYSFLGSKTALGLRSFPLTGLSELSDELREIVTSILLKPPISNILLLSAYTPTMTEIIPITLLQPIPEFMGAA